MSRASRLLDLLITLRTRPRFTVQEMADDFGVSRRTMLRDLHALSEIGVPLQATPGPYGGYALITGGKLLPLSMSVDEAIGIVLSYEAFVRSAQSPFSAQSLSAVTKLRNAMPADVVRTLDRLRAYVAVEGPARTEEAPLLADLLSAAMDRVHVKVIYDSASGRNERLVFPFGLFMQAGLWYCAVYDYRRSACLSLRGDRFISLERVDDLQPPEVPLVREWLATRWRDASNLIPLRARLTTRGAKSLEIENLFGPVVTDANGEARLETRIPPGEIEYYASRLLTLGAEIVVESPPQLVAAMLRQMKEISRLYC